METTEGPEQGGQTKCLIEEIGQMGPEGSDQIVDPLWIKVVVERGIIITVTAETNQ